MNAPMIAALMMFGCVAVAACFFVPIFSFGWKHGFKILGIVALIAAGVVAFYFVCLLVVTWTGWFL